MKKNKTMCSRCRNNRYNFPGTCERPGIDSVVTSKECWSFKDAKVVKRKRVSIHQTPPYKNKKEYVLDCMQEQDYAYIDDEK